MNRSPDRRQLATLAAVLVAVGAYVVLFYSVRLPSVEQVTGEPFRRAGFFLYVLMPEVLLGAWFGSPPELALLDRLPVLAVAAGLLVAAAAIGWLMLRLLAGESALTKSREDWATGAAGRLSAGAAETRVGKPPVAPKCSSPNTALTPLETLTFSLAVGLNAVSTCVLAAGLLGWLHGAVFAVPGLAAVAAAAWLFWRGRKRSASPARTRHAAAEQAEPGGIDRRWGWLAGPFVLVIVLGGMLPPVDFDVREYHLQAPKEFFEQGRITFLPHNVYANMPLGAEMHALLAMVLTGDWWLGALVGKTIIALYAPLTALGLLAAGRRWFGPGAGLVAAVGYVSVPWIVQVSTAGLIDAVLGCNLFLAVYAVLIARQDSTEGCGPAKRWALYGLAGYLAGAAAATKYPGILFAVVPLAFWIGAAHRFPRRVAMRPLAVFALAALLGGGLWYAKNAALTGNPAYPLLYGQLGGATWTEQKDRQWNHVHRPHDFSRAALRQDLSRVALTSEWLSPWLVPLAALAVARRRQRPMVLALLAYLAAALAAWWMLTHRIDRFWLPLLPLVALLAGAGAGWSSHRLWRVALFGLLAIGSLSNFLVIGSGAPGIYNRFFVSLERLRDDPLRVGAWTRRWNHEPDVGCLLLIGKADVFDFRVPILYSTCFDSLPLKALGRSPRAAEMGTELASRGVTHIYVDWAEIERYRATSYGFADSVTQEAFDSLVGSGVLKPLSAIEGDPGRAYRVISPHFRLPRMRGAL